MVAGDLNELATRNGKPSARVRTIGVLLAGSATAAAIVLKPFVEEAVDRIRGKH